MQKICESCGMPMKQISEFGGSNPDNKYCKYCTHENGELKEFDLKLKEMTSFIVSRMNINETVAEKIARENMSKMPAWQKYFE